ncbi:hypothetical protein NSMS1_66380 (plasmid) [Nostoc sp. MS1]|nr:hypothetical protein NSMS1_66380 [Nostoc sp. MS1]
MRVAYGWVDKASNILNNKIGLDAAGVKQSYHQLLTEMSQQKQKAGTLNTAIDNFIKPPTATGLDFFIVMKLKIFLELIMT